MKSKIITVIMAVLVFIPIAITKFNIAKTDESTEPVEIKVEVETEIATESLRIASICECSNMVVRTPQFKGYDFIPLSTDEQMLIKGICDKYELAYELMMAIAKQESNYDMSAHNSVSDDWGMWQINVDTWDSTANEMGLYDYRTDISHNAEMACYIVSYCLDMANGNLRVALNYYRTGTPHNKYEADSDYASIVMNNINEIEYQKMEDCKNDYHRF